MKGINRHLEENEKYTRIVIGDDRVYGLAKVINKTLFIKPLKINEVIIIYEEKE